MEDKDVFISYKAEELKEAAWLRDTLEKNGISCWMAPESIPGGSNYAVEIPRAIQSCKVFVLVLSQKAQASPWIAKELDRAINANKIVMPFMIENCQLEDAFNFYLTNVQRYEAYESKAQAMGKMVAEIRAIIGANANEQPPVNIPPQPAAPKEKTAPKPKTSPQKTSSFINKFETFMKILFWVLIFAGAALIGVFWEEIVWVAEEEEMSVLGVIWEMFVLLCTPFGQDAASLAGFTAPLVASTVCTAIWFLFALIVFFLGVETLKSKAVKFFMSAIFAYFVWYASFGVCHWLYSLPAFFSVVLAIIANAVIGIIIGFIFVIAAVALE